MSDKQVKQIQRIIEQNGILGFLKLASDVIGNKVITENADPKSRLACFNRNFEEFYIHWHGIDYNGWNKGQLP